MDQRFKDALKDALNSTEFDHTVCKLLVATLEKDMTKLYIAHNTGNDSDFHSHFSEAMDRVFVLRDQLSGEPK